MRKIVLTIIGVFLLTLLATESNAAKKKKTFDELSVEILESIQSFYPVRSTEMGIHSYDHRFTDYSSKSVNRMIKKLNGYIKNKSALRRFNPSKLSKEQQLSYKLIRSNLLTTLHDLKKLRWHKKSPQLYVDEAVNGLYFLLISKHAPMSEKIVPIIDRIRSVPALFATARKNLKKPPPIYIEAAKESLESGMEFYQIAAGELMAQFPERADNILKVSTAAREAMNDFLLWLDEVTPGKEIDFAIGKEAFDYRLEHEYFMNINSDTLLAIGLSLLEQAQKEYHEYEEYVELNHQNGADSVYIPRKFEREDILDYYNWETNQVKVFIETNDLLSIPDDIAPVTVIETPPFLRSMISGIAYQPAGPFDQNQHGYFYVRPIPDSLTRKQLDARYRYIHRRGFKGSVVHEAFPGHHLQMQIAARNSDPIRKWQMNRMMVEGWALYCEEMMYDQGLFGKEDPSQWLGILGGIRFRAARIVADVKLHTGQFTVEQCIDWMNKELDSNTDWQREYIRKEVRRYTLSPTYQMAYLMGKREILKLRDAMEQRDGPLFSLAEFHDALLAEGSVPVTLLWEHLGLEKSTTSTDK